MLNVQFLNDTGGTLISSLAVGSVQTITTKGIDTSRLNFQGQHGMYLIFTGTVNGLTQEVSYDNTNWYTPWDKNASLGQLIVASANNSRFISFVTTNSANVPSPFKRYNVTMLSGGTLSLVYVADEV